MVRTQLPTRARAPTTHQRAPGAPGPRAGHRGGAGAGPRGWRWDSEGTESGCARLAPPEIREGSLDKFGPCHCHHVTNVPCLRDLGRRQDHCPPHAGSGGLPEVPGLVDVGPSPEPRSPASPPGAHGALAASDTWPPHGSGSVFPEQSRDEDVSQCSPWTARVLPHPYPCVTPSIRCDGIGGGVGPSGATRS